MLILGAKGFSREVLQILNSLGYDREICFYDDITPNPPHKIYDEFPLIRSLYEASEYFRNVNRNFALGIGNPKLRFSLSEKFEKLGGQLTSTISKAIEVGTYNVNIGIGCNILSGVRISNDVSIGRGSMIYYNSIVTHDVVIGDFVEISPGVILLGRCKLGDFVQIGAGAIIFPDVVIGNNCIIGAGAVVKVDIPENSTAVGIPAKVIKQI